MGASWIPHESKIAVANRSRQCNHFQCPTVVLHSHQFFSPRSSSFVTGATRHLLDKNTLSNTMLKQVFSIRAVSGPRCRLAENLAANGRSPQDTLSWRNWKPGSLTGATSHLGQKRNRSISRQQKSTIHTGTSSHLRRPQNRLIWRQWNWRITYCGVELFVQFRPNAGLAM